jgi:Helix-turn-helix domain
MARKHDKERNDRYFQLHHYMLRTDAWKALSAAAVRVYIQIGSRYNGANNGRLVFSVRDAAGECNLDKGTASRAFKELVDRGFIEETRHGSLSKKTRIASEWRLTAFKCDLTGSLKTCAFMQRGGSEYSSHAPQKRGPLPGALRPSPVRINSRECPKKLPTLSETTPDEATECPKQLPTQADFGSSPVRNNYTHIIYQSLGTDGTAKGSPARPADTAVAAPVFDLIEDAFRIGDRRIELRKPAADAMDLTAGLLAQQLAASHPSNADKSVRPRLTVIAAAPTPAIAAE